MDFEVPESNSQPRSPSPTTTTPSKSGWRHQTARATRKFIEVVTRLATSVIVCAPRSSGSSATATIDVVESEEENNIRLLDLPNEVLLMVLSNCDFNSKMNMRAVSRRLHDLIEDSAHKMTRINLVGGVEIERVEQPTTSGSSGGGPTSNSPPPLQLTLRRPANRREILLPAARLTNIMRHVCVCHSLRLRDVPLDEDLALDLLSASFRAVTHLIVDRVHSVSSDTLGELVKSVYPSNVLRLLNHDSSESQTAISPVVFDRCPATEVTILSDIEHRQIDDDALLRLILCDLTVRRNIRLPLCAVTHKGILSAARQFFDRCQEIRAELTAEMELPRWEITVSLPPSNLIDVSQITQHLEAMPYCHVIPHTGSVNSFLVHVRVEAMSLLIRVH